jgi:Uma2 family endonuclease
MMSTAERLVLSEDEYLAMERASEQKREYVNGEAVAMAGASPRHNRIVANLIIALGTRLEGGPCAPLPSDQRVHVPRTGLYTYPDVSVLCGPGEYHEKDPNALRNPRVIFEVLSDSTEAYDRGAKFDHYRRIPSLEEYVLVWQKERRVMHHRRQTDGRWVMTEIPPGEAVELPALGLSLPFAAIYRDAEKYPAD